MSPAVVLAGAVLGPLAGLKIGLVVVTLAVCLASLNRRWWRDPAADEARNSKEKTHDPSK